MSERSALIYIAIGILLVGYLGLNILLAPVVDIQVYGATDNATAGRYGRSGTARTIETDKGKFDFIGLPFFGDTDEMKAKLRPGTTARVQAIYWAHAPLWAGITGRESKPSIISVESP